MSQIALPTLTTAHPVQEFPQGRSHPSGHTQLTEIDYDKFLEVAPPDYYKNPLLGRDSVGQLLLRKGLMGFSNLVWVSGDWRGLGSPFFRLGREIPLQLTSEPEYVEQESAQAKITAALCGPDSWAIEVEVEQADCLYGGAPGKLHHWGGTAQQQWMAFDPFRDGARLEITPEGHLISSNGSYLAVIVGEGLELSEAGNGWEAKIAPGRHGFGVGIAMGDLALATKRALAARAETLSPLGLQKVRSRLRQEWKEIMGKFDLEGQTDALDLPLAENAIWCIYSNVAAPEGHFRRRAVIGAKIQYPSVFPWDSAFAGLALHRSDPLLAKDQIELYTDGMSPERPQGPGIFSALKPTGGTQLPLFSMVSWRIFAAEPDEEFLQRVYPKLALHADWWSTEFASSEGIPCFHELICYDDTPRFDIFSGQGRMSLAEPVYGADLIAICAMDRMYLAKMAMALGAPEEAELHLAKARRFADFIEKHLYDEKLERFVDVGVNSGKIGCVNTPMNHFPAFLSAHPRRQKAALQALSATGPFWGHFGLATVAPEEAAFDPCRIWRGPIWLSVNFLCAYASAAMNGADVAEAIAESSRAVIRANRPLQAGFMEYFNYQTGEGSGAHHIATMSAAPYLAMVLGYHQAGVDVSREHLGS